MPIAGAHNETDRLLEAIVRCPESELDRITEREPMQALWHSRPDPERAKRQHKELTTILTDNGVRVVNITGEFEYPNLCFCRDQFITMPKGHLLSCFAHPCRNGEEAIAEDALLSVGAAASWPTSCSGPYEGGDFVLIGDSVMLAGISGRTYRESIEGLGPLFNQGGVRAVISLPVPDTILHLDCGVLPIDERRILTAIPIPSATRHFLEHELGFSILSIPLSWTGAAGLGLNALYLAPGLILISNSASVSLVQLLRDAGVRPLFVDVSEFEKGGGSIHCLVAPVSRAPAAENRADT